MIDKLVFYWTPLSDFLPAFLQISRLVYREGMIWWNRKRPLGSHNSCEKCCHIQNKFSFAKTRLENVLCHSPIVILFSFSNNSEILTLTFVFWYLTTSLVDLLRFREVKFYILKFPPLKFFHCFLVSYFLHQISNACQISGQAGGINQTSHWLLGLVWASPRGVSLAHCWSVT